MGGLSKKAFQYDLLRKEQNIPSLTLDGGSLLFQKDSVAKSQEHQARTTAEGIVKAYNLMGYDGVGVSRRDLASGLDFLLEMQDKSKFAWLSANIIDKSTDKTLFRPTISRQIGDIRIDIIGITDQLPANSELLNQDTVIRSWQDTLPEIIKRLSYYQTFIILLTSLSEKECLEIAKTYPAINLIINSGDFDASQPPINLTDTTTMVRTGRKGKYIGIMNINYFPGGKWQNNSHRTLVVKKKEKERLTRQLALLQDRPKSAGTYKRLRDHLQEIEETIERITNENKSYEENDFPPSSYNNRFIAMQISLPDHPAVMEIVGETKRLMNRSVVTSQNNKLIQMGYIGWEECRKCHNRQVDNWRKTRHSSSFTTLIEKNQHLNLNCLPCHVTGVGITDPGAAINLPSYLQTVGCESCHGPGAAHSDEPKSNKPPAVTEKICLNCHDVEHDGSFDFDKDLDILKCKR